MEASTWTQNEDRQVLRWLRQARGGSKEALGQALEAYRNYLGATARRLLPGDLRAKGSASDLVQESLLDAYRRFDTFRGASPVELLGWLNRILRNRVSKFSRTYRTDKRSLNREQSLSLDGPNRPDPPAAAAAAPDQSALSRERAEQVTRAVDQLPAYYKQVIEFRHRYQLQFSEIALLLGKSEVAIRRAWARGLERLRHDIEDPTLKFEADCRPTDAESP